MLPGASSIARNILLEFIKLADLEIEGAESILFMMQGERPKRNLVGQV